MTTQQRTIDDAKFKQINELSLTRSVKLEAVMHGLFGDGWDDCADEAESIYTTIMLFLAVPEAGSLETIARYRSPSQETLLYKWAAAFDAAGLTREELATCAFELNSVAN